MECSRKVWIANIAVSVVVMLMAALFAFAVHRFGWEHVSEELHSPGIWRLWVRLAGMLALMYGIVFVFTPQKRVN